MAPSPSQEARRRRKKAGEVDDIPDEEKWRIISESGLLSKIPNPSPKIHSVSDDDDEEQSTQALVWQAVMLVIPFGFLYGIMDILVQQQFDEVWTLSGVAMKTIKVAPMLGVIIFFTNKLKARPWMQFLMTLAAMFCGSSLLYTIKRTPTLGEMEKCPGLATLWIYFIVQLNLAPAIMSLFTTFLLYHIFVK
ncbi:uncharacterized protein VTP21DRAFT_4379 [Calcarisporiella thermophila]|uniref:uncharacterized protein n=1 Tax=Calcarisporiella thermophila TaxID=911321 RepID=UPI00374204E4